MAKFKKKYDTPLYWHELLDRAHCLNVMYEEMICNHPVSSHPELRGKISEVGAALGELYQTIGANYK